MKRINPIWLYRLGGATRIFARFTPETKYGDVQGWNDFRTDCGFAYVWLNWLLDHPEIPLVDCHEAAQYLKHFLVSTGNYAPDELLGAERHHVVKFHFDQFQTQLETELAKTNIYHVTKVNAYDTDTLLSRGKMALPADESLIDFHVTGKLAQRAALQRVPNPMQHEPSGLLRDAQRPPKLIGTDAILGVDDHPQRGQPLVEPKGTFLEYRARLHRELPLAVPAFPPLATTHECDLHRLTSGTTRFTVRPMDIRHELQRAISISEILNRFSQSLRKIGLRFHGYTFAHSTR